MKKTTIRNTPFMTARLGSVTGGTRAQILDLGGANPPAEQESDIRAQIVDIG